MYCSIQSRESPKSPNAILFQRLIFWVQAPAALILGPLLFFAIPAAGEDNPLEVRKLLHKLARVDYAGALTLVCSTNSTCSVWMNVLSFLRPCR